MKKIIALFIIAVFLASCAAWGYAKNGGGIRFGISNDPEGLDPHRSVSASTFLMTNNIYDTLVGVAANGKLFPRLAQKWSVSPDGMAVTFVLRKGVKFHNGRELTAFDVQYSFNRLTAKESPRAGDYKNITDMKVNNPYSITFTTGKLDVALLSTFAYPWAAIVPKEAADALKTNPIGSGPFICKEWVPHQHVILEKYPGYFGKPARLDKVTFVTVPLNTSQLASLQAHELDIISISGDQAQSLKSDPNIVLLNQPQYTVQVLALNNANKALSNIKVRQAIATALDKKAIITGANWGFGAVIGSHMPPSDPFYVNTISVLKHNPAKAKKLLEEAGYKGGLTLRLALPKPYPINVDSGLIVEDQLKKIGIDVQVDIMEWAAWLKDVYTGRQYDMTIIGHTGRLDPYVLLRRYASDSSENYYNYKNEKIDRLLAAASQETNLLKRKELYKEIQIILAREVPAVYLQTPYSLMAMNKRVKGMAIYPIDIYELKDIYLEQ